MATRLNKGMREEILACAMDGAFFSVLEQTRKDLYIAGRALFDQAMGPHFEAVRALPKDMHTGSTTDMAIRFKREKGKKTISVEIPRHFKYGYPNRLHCYNDAERENYPTDPDVMEQIRDHKNIEDDSFPVSLCFWLDLKYTAGDPALVKATREALVKYEQVETDKKELHKSLNAILNSAYSVEKLLELWPNAANYLPMLPIKGKGLAINVPNLDKLLEKAKNSSSFTPRPYPSI